MEPHRTLASTLADDKRHTLWRQKDQAHNSGVGAGGIVVSLTAVQNPESTTYQIYRLKDCASISSSEN